MRGMTPTFESFAQTATASGAMILSQCAEISLTHRAESDLPVRVIECLTGRTAPRGRVRVVAGQMTQGSLAALAVISARSMSHVPAPVAVRAGSFVLSHDQCGRCALCDLADLPWSWRGRDLAADLIQKTALADRHTLRTRGAQYRLLAGSETSERE